MGWDFLRAKNKTYEENNSKLRNSLNKCSRIKFDFGFIFSSVFCCCKVEVFETQGGGKGGGGGNAWLAPF